MSDIESPPWVCGYILCFADRLEGQELHRGTQGDCEEMAGLLPAVAVSTGESCDARIYTIPADKWDAIWADEVIAKEQKP